MTTMTKIAIFPLPNTVAFPGMVIPLHIFEPRYRLLFRECTEKNIFVALAFPKKTLKQFESSQSDPEKIHAQNLSTYEPCSIVCGGKAHIKRNLDDGRMLADISCRKVFRIEKFLQSVPYYLAEASEIVLTEPSSKDALILVQALQTKASDLLIRDVQLNSEGLHPRNLIVSLRQMIHWTLEWLPVETAVKQQILETFSMATQAEMVLDLMELWTPERTAERPTDRNPPHTPPNTSKSLPITKKSGNLIEVNFSAH